jgi:hypothetical protein
MFRSGNGVMFWYSFPRDIKLLKSVTKSHCVTTTIPTDTLRSAAIGERVKGVVESKKVGSLGNICWQRKGSSE